MTEAEQALAEDVRALHAKLDALTAARGTTRHGWLRHFVKDLETNPHTQYRIHLVASWYWVANFPVIALLFFGFPRLWVGLGLLINTFYSLYANFATDYGAVSAALAAVKYSKEDEP